MTSPTIAEVVRDEIMRYPTAPSTYPPFAPAFLANEHTIAAAVTAHLAAILADPETVEAVAEALGLKAESWGQSLPGSENRVRAAAAIAVIGARLGLA